MRLRAVQLLLAAALTSSLMLASVPAAHGAHHLVRINEVHPGLTTDPEAEYVELKLTSLGENQVTGTSVRIFGATGTESTPAPTFIMNPPNPESQRTILVGTADAATHFMKSMDLLYTNADRIDPAGGAVCFDSPTFAGVDCVSWGTFPPATVLPDGTGSTPHGTPEPGPIANESSLHRSMTPNCPTLLELGDDTNDSANDFSILDSETPRNNADPAEGTACTTLQVLRAGSGTGSVAGNGTPAIACPTTCFTWFQTADTANLTATPGGNSTFTGWTNCPTPSGTECEAPMNVNRTITANFTSNDPGTPPGGTVLVPPALPLQTNPPPPPPPKKCKKGQVKRKGKCVKKRKK